MFHRFLKAAAITFAVFSLIAAALLLVESPAESILGSVITGVINSILTCGTGIVVGGVFFFIKYNELTNTIRPSFAFGFISVLVTPLVFYLIGIIMPHIATVLICDREGEMWTTYLFLLPMSMVVSGLFGSGLWQMCFKEYR